MEALFYPSFKAKAFIEIWLIALNTILKKIIWKDKPKST